MSRSYSSKFGSALSFVAVVIVVLQPNAAFADSQSISRVTSSRDVSTQDTVVTISAPAADVELRQGGVLVGQVVAESGIGCGKTIVHLTNGRQSWQATTNADGWFRFVDLSGGTYQFRVEGQTQVLRAWSRGTAPPNASQGVLVTPASDVFRGQRVLSPNTNQFFRVAKQRMTDPLVVGGVIVTAVAIPVAIHNSDDDPPASP